MTQSSSQSKVSQLCTTNMGRIGRYMAYAECYNITEKDVEYVYGLLDEITELSEQEEEVV